MDDAAQKRLEGADRRAGYKSWKKKYRKMRIVFDQKMHDGEELHKNEAQAAATIKRLAIENDRLLDLLLEINNSPQIVPHKRFDLALPANSSKLTLPIDPDRPASPSLPQPQGPKLARLEKDVPHWTYAEKKDDHALIADVTAFLGETYPAHFVSPDDLDSYLAAVDATLHPEPGLDKLPTPPSSSHNAHQVTNPQLKNPTSVTNWLRKHAPKTFLQDNEVHSALPHDDDNDQAQGGALTPTASHTGGKKTRASRGDRGGKASARGKKSRASLLAHDRDADASMDEDPEHSTPVPKGKRKRDDDGGYRPKGGSSARPTKKKRKSDGGAETPTAPSRKSKKETPGRDD